MNITFLDLSMPESHPIVRGLGKARFRILGQAIGRFIVRGLEDDDPEAARIVGLILAWLKHRAQKDHVAAVGDEFDEVLAEKGLQEVKQWANVIKAAPAAARPSGARFWLRNDRMFADRELPSITIPAGVVYFVCGGLAPPAAEIFAFLLGGRFMAEPPVWIIGDESELTKPRERQASHRVCSVIE